MLPLNHHWLISNDTQTPIFLCEKLVCYFRSIGIEFVMLRDSQRLDLWKINGCDGSNFATGTSSGDEHSYDSWISTISTMVQFNLVWFKKLNVVSTQADRQRTGCRESQKLYMNVAHHYQTIPVLYTNFAIDDEWALDENGMLHSTESMASIENGKQTNRKSAVIHSIRITVVCVCVCTMISLLLESMRITTKEKKMKTKELVKQQRSNGCAMCRYVHQTAEQCLIWLCSGTAIQYHRICIRLSHVNCQISDILLNGIVWIWTDDALLHTVRTHVPQR